MLRGRSTVCASLGAIIVFMLAFTPSAFSSADQLTVERILAENKSYIEFMDACITNFGEAKVSQYKEIYQMYFNAEVAFLQSDYKGSFKRIYSLQGKFAELISDVLKNSYLESSKDILDQLAPEIIKSKNTRAKLYLTLGYRDRAVAYNYFTIGTASNPKLFSYKIFRFIESIKMARRAKRYGFYALYESQTDEMKMKIFNHLFEMEREAGNRFYNRFLNKNGDAFLAELNKNIEDLEKEEKTETGAPETKKEGAPDREAGTFEKKLERRVRLRNEKTVAQYLINAEYEKAEDIIRNYIEDSNFKLIKACFEVLAAKPREAGSGVSYQDFLLHHTDDYARLSKASVLQSFAGTVKVEDFVEKDTGDKDAVTEKKDGVEKEKDAGKTEPVKGKEESGK